MSKLDLECDARGMQSLRNLNFIATSSVFTRPTGSRGVRLILSLQRQKLLWDLLDLCAILIPLS